MLEDTKQRLKDWGNWSRSNGHNLGFSSVKLNAPIGGCNVPDHEAMEVDDAVSKCKDMDPEMGRLLVRRYLQGWDYSMIGEEMGKSRDKVRHLLGVAEGYVAGRLYS